VPTPTDRTTEPTALRVTLSTGAATGTVPSGPSVLRNAEGARLPTGPLFLLGGSPPVRGSYARRKAATAVPHDTSARPARTTATPIPDWHAEAIAREREQCRRLDAAIAELVAAAEPLWHRGDGYGGHVLGSLHGAIRAAGLPAQEWGKWPEVRKQFARRKAQLIAAIAQRDGYECEVCGSVADLQVDHKVPVALGGKNDLDNLHFLCRDCNAAKGTMTWAVFLADLMAEGD
jgi:hypothetical protein